MIISTKAGFTRGIRWTIGATPMVLGRSPDCDIVIDDVTVSRRQCKIWEKDGALHLQDLGGVNAPLVNGEPMRNSTLQEGDELTIGAAQFSVSGADETAAIPGPAPKEDTRTLSIGEFHECYLHQAFTPDQLPKLQSDYILVFQLGRMLASQQTSAAVWQAVRQAVETRFPAAYLWCFECVNLEPKLIAGATLEIVRDTVTPLARAALESEEATLNSSRTGLSGSGVMTVPLFAGKKRAGAMVLANDDTRRPFTQDDLSTFVAMGEIIGPFLDAVIRSQHLAEVCERLSRNAETNSPLVGAGPAVTRLREDITRLANTSLNVLIRGESGTGKELVARSLHDLSARSSGPFFPVNCAAVPANLFESEFFGHVKGAFTGAGASRPGIFDRADGGTLFLDEIGDLSPENQAKLLRVLENGRFIPVGAREESHVDVRVVAATNRELRPPGFREDLYHRLASAVLETTPLHSHPGDIPLLARHFLDEIAARDERLFRTLSEGAIAFLVSQPWHGNGRELRNAVVRAAHLSRGTEISAEDFGAGFGIGGEGPEPLKTLEEVEMEHIQRVLGACDGNMREAARILGISRSSLYTKVPRHVRQS